MEAIFALAAFAIILVIFFGLIPWISRSKSYRAWEMKHLHEWLEEKKSRPKPPWADDPIAKTIEWTGTSAFGSDPSPNPKGAVVRIGLVSTDRIEFHPPSTRRWHTAMVFMGVVSYILGLISTESFITALLGPLICVTLSVMAELYNSFIADTVVFDKQLGMYWRGKSPPAPVSDAVSTEKVGLISDIYALQLIGTRRFVGDPRMGADSEYKEFPTHELNLVLKDGTRLSMVCNDDYGSIDHAAQILADFLQRPLWKPG